jgi:hypothetical protein
VCESYSSRSTISLYPDTHKKIEPKMSSFQQDLKMPRATQRSEVVCISSSAAASPSAVPASPKQVLHHDEEDEDATEYDANYKLPPVIGGGDASELEEMMSNLRRKQSSSSSSSSSVSNGNMVTNGLIIEGEDNVPQTVGIEKQEESSQKSSLPSSSQQHLYKKQNGSRRCSSTIPMWLGCAILCTILVGVIGFAPFFATQANNEIVVGTARNSYNTAVGNTGVKIYYKFVNELITLVLAFSQANFKPLKMTAVDFSNPFWDREWQLFFLGASVTVPTRHFYYMDLATGHFTGQYPTGPNRTDMMRIVGNVNDVNVTLYRRSALPPLQFQPASSATLLFPPAMMFNTFFAKGEGTSLVAPSLDMRGEMVYGYASIVTSPLTTPPYVIPVGALLELLPLDEMISAAETVVTNIARYSGESVVVEDNGALVACSRAPFAENIYVPLGTPGAICSTVVYNNMTLSKCRHSLTTLRLAWPLLGAAYDAYFSGANGSRPMEVNLNDVRFQTMNFSYVTFQFEGQEYMVSASSPSIVTGSGWWTAAITPTAPVYGPYIANRDRTIFIVALVCAGMALLVLVLTYMLMRPLGALMEEMISALRLQTQSDRYAKAILKAADQSPSRGTSVAICGGWRLHVSELHEIDLAVVCLHDLLEEVATMLSPPVILMIRTSLARRTTAHGLSSSTTSSDDTGTVGGGSLSSSDGHGASSFPHSSMRSSSPQNNISKVNSTSNNISDRHEDENLEQMLTWFEDQYRAKGPVLPPPLQYAAVVAGIHAESDATEVVAMSKNDRQGHRIEVVSLEPSAAPKDPAEKSTCGDGVDPVPPLRSTAGILMNPSVSLRPARRRGFFMAVSLAQLQCRPLQFAGAIAPLLSLVWHHGGEVEMIERNLLLATFGCYVEGEGSASRAAACAIAIAENRTRAQRSSRSPTNDSQDEQGVLEHTAKFTIAIDCGWFETSTLSCVLPTGRTMRRQVVSSVARDVVIKMLSLGEVLNERLLISGDALRHVDATSLLGRTPVIMDHLRFDVKSWSKVSRRGSVFIFSVQTLMLSLATVSAPSRDPQALPENLSAANKNRAKMVAEGFRLMINAKYPDAELYFKKCLDKCARAGHHRDRTLARMLALSSVFSNILRIIPGTELAPYYRGECSQFDISAGEKAYLSALAAARELTDASHNKSGGDRAVTSTVGRSGAMIATTVSEAF